MNSQNWITWHALFLKKHGGQAERNTLHDQKVVGSNPTSVSMLRPWAELFIPSCSTPPRCNNGELL